MTWLQVSRRHSLVGIDKDRVLLLLVVAGCVVAAAAVAVVGHLLGYV